MLLNSDAVFGIYSGYRLHCQRASRNRLDLWLAWLSSTMIPPSAGMYFLKVLTQRMQASMLVDSAKMYLHPDHKEEIPPRMVNPEPLLLMPLSYLRLTSNGWSRCCHMYRTWSQLKNKRVKNAAQKDSGNENLNSRAEYSPVERKNLLRLGSKVGRRTYPPRQDCSPNTGILTIL